VNVVLPARGRVYVGPLDIIQHQTGEDPLVCPGQWWSERTAGLVGGIGGGVLGIMGGFIGWLSWRGRARSLVLGLMYGMFAIGIITLVLAGISLSASQPYPVYYPLLLGGGLLTLLSLVGLPSVRKRYEQIELQKMSAADALPA
jgi:hypothetical protein